MPRAQRMREEKWGMRLEKEEGKMEGRKDGRKGGREGWRGGREEEGRGGEEREAGREVAGQVRAKADEGTDPMGEVKDFSFYHPKNNDKVVKVFNQGQG